MVAAAATGTWLAVIAEDDYLARAGLLATGVACALLAGGLLLRRAMVIPGAVVLLAVPYVAILAFERDALDPRAPVIAGMLFAVAELAYWSFELRGALVDEPGTYLRRIALLAALVLGTVVAGTATLAFVDAVATRGLAVDLAGAVAAVAAIALLALAASRRSTDQ